jgi:site-specific DNA-methyltransferase (adenine-specific)
MSNLNRPWKNKLYFGDNLDILRDKIPDNSVDLIYLDPPFQSGKNYNQIFQSEQGEIKGATAQAQAFEDTWEWGPEAENDYEGLITGRIGKEKPTQKLIDLMKAMRNYLGEVPMMAYLSMMAPRLLEMRRVLKNTGSIYLHCDPTASHYLKLLMDAVFGIDNFINELVWSYGARATVRKSGFPQKHDTIFFYSKSSNYFYNPLYTGRYKDPELKRYNKIDESGRRYALIKRVRSATGEIYYGKTYPNEEGAPMTDVWDIPTMASTSSERIGYPTQKPEALLERMIRASSNKNDLVLDPFCGCGTTVAVSQKLGRKWIGIDITYLAIDVISKRLNANGVKKDIDFDIDGEPKDIYSAEKLAAEDPFQFQIWCVSKLNATPSQVKSGDEGVDGIINFVDKSKKNKFGKGIIQVKGTQAVMPGMVRDLKGTMMSQGADFAILIILKRPTRGMIVEAVKEGSYEFGYTKESSQFKIPKIQLLAVEDIFQDPLPIKLPPTAISPFKKPVIGESAKQKELF